MKLFLGVDGGQSSTTALIGDETGRVIGHGRGGPCNHISGPEARENFGIRVLGRYSVAAWRVLVPEITPIPPKSTIRGRVQVCVAGEREETQVAYLEHHVLVGNRVHSVSIVSARPSSKVSIGFANMNTEVPGKGYMELGGE